MKQKNSKERILYIISILAILVPLLIIIHLTYGLMSKHFYTQPISQNLDQIKKPMSYHTNILKETAENSNFRHVLFTGKNSQLVIMSIPPGGEVGTETHKYTEQTLFFFSGIGEGMLDDERFPVGPGDVVVIVPGTKHNFVNTGTEDLKIYTTYSPPNHIDGLIEATKADAGTNIEDEKIGETPLVK